MSCSLPYAPSSVVELTEISPQLRHIKDFVFLAGFNEPTLAILTQPEQTWTGWAHYLGIIYLV